MVLGQMVTVPLNFCSQISLQSWPIGRGRSSKWRSTRSHLFMSNLMYCSMADPRKPPRQPRPFLWVTGRPTAPRELKKKRLMCGFTCKVERSVVRLVCIGWAHTCETIVKLTLKWRFSALMGMSVRKLPSFHL